MPRAAASYAAMRFASHWFGDLPPGPLHEWLLKYSEACAALFDSIHTEVLAAPQGSTVHDAQSPVNADAAH